MRFQLLAFALILAPVAAHATDPTAEARAKAALALATAKAPPSAAPTPRSAPTNYAAAKALSLVSGKPVVVYVGCSGKHDMVRSSQQITVGVDSLEGYAAGEIVVCYPSAGHLWCDQKLTCPATPAEIGKAVENAKKKTPAAPKKALDWS